MSNVLKEEKRQQVLALGRLGWSLRRIEEATGVRRETASGYLKAAGLTVRGRGRPPARPAKPAISPEAPTDSSPTTAAGEGTAAAAPVPAQQPSRAPQASACEPYRELIVDALGRGRNATAIWQDLVDDHGFPAGYTSVRRFVSTRPAAACRHGSGGDHHRSRERKLKSTTAKDRWSVTLTPASTGGHGSSS